MLAYLFDVINLAECVLSTRFFNIYILPIMCLGFVIACVSVIWRIVRGY